MQSLKQSLIVAGSLLALGSIGTIMNQFRNPAALRADDGGPKVTIAAPLPLPVSVTGTPGVNVNNTPNVNVTNSPTVQVGNTSSSPVLTRSVDNPGLQPFQISLQGPLTTPLGFAVPPGKTLVIEHFSVLCQEPAASVVQTDFRLFTNVNGVESGYFFAPTLLLTGVLSELITNQATHIYANGGTLVTIGTGNLNPSGTNCGVSVAGHLVSAL